MAAKATGSSRSPVAPRTVRGTRAVWIDTPSGLIALISLSGTTSACGMMIPIRARQPQPSGRTTLLPPAPERLTPALPLVVGEPCEHARIPQRDHAQRCPWRTSDPVAARLADGRTDERAVVLAEP